MLKNPLLLIALALTGLVALWGIIDTLLNLWVFAFIGILIWLYFKKDSDGNIAGRQERDRDTLA